MCVTMKRNREIYKVTLVGGLVNVLLLLSLWQASWDIVLRWWQMLSTRCRIS